MIGPTHESHLWATSTGTRVLIEEAGLSSFESFSGGLGAGCAWGWKQSFPVSLSVEWCIGLGVIETWCIAMAEHWHFLNIADFGSNWYWAAC